jgi:Tripartite tricarboxylate transporter family receptor
VPYRGGAPALIDLLGGRVQVMFDTIPQAFDYIRHGKLRRAGCHHSDTLADTAERACAERFCSWFPGRKAVGTYLVDAAHMSQVQQTGAHQHRSRH